MTGERLVPIALLVCSMVALGTMAGSLDATVTSSPNDAIDLDSDSLPFLGDGKNELADSYERGADSPNEARAPSSGDDGSADGPDADSSGDVPGLGGDQAQADASSGGDGQQQADGRGSGGDRSEPSDGGGSGDSGGDSGGDQSGTGSGGSSDSSPSLVEWLLVLALAVLAILTIVVAAVVAIRRRERLLALLRGLADRYGLAPAADAAPDGGQVTGVEPQTVVEDAWAEMLSRSGADCADSDTPRECATAAIAAGVSREPAESLTSMYEQVRYGERPVTPDLARQALCRLREVPRYHGSERA